MRRQRLLIILLILLAVFYVIYNHVDEEKETKENYTVKADVIDRIINENINSSMSEYDKVKAIHDYIVINTEYDNYNLKNNTIPDIDYTAKGVLEKKIGVCRGYAEAFKLLMDNLNIECEILTGKADNISHAWNVVKLDNEWYHVDCTFDDPLSVDNTNLNTIRYDYFLITDEQIYDDHNPEANPYVCTSDKYMYQEKVPGIPYHILESIYQISNSISYMHVSGEKSATFYFPESIITAENVFNNNLPEELSEIKGIKQLTYTPIIKCGKYNYTTITIS